MNLDLLVVLVLVGIAVAFVVRKYAGKAKGGKGPACGSCNNCGDSD